MSNEATDLLLQLIQKCKFSVSVTVNQHRDYHESVQDHMNNLVASNAADLEDFADVLPEMIRKDTIIDVHFYPETSVGFYNIYHHDLIEALKEALKLLPDNSFYPSEEAMINVVKKAQELDEAGEQ